MTKGTDKDLEPEKTAGRLPYVHTNEGYVVAVTMTGEIDATEAICDYSRKRTERIC